MDVNGKKGPNSETIDGKYKDIRSFGGARLASSAAPAPTCAGDLYNDTCVYFVGTSYTSINCNAPSGELYSYCSPTPSTYTNDYWAGAKYKCDSMGMTLPTVAQLQAIYADKANYPSIASNTGWFWSSEEDSCYPKYGGRYVYFFNGNAYDGSKNYQSQVLCVGN